jgi:hypothetical protein
MIARTDGALAITASMSVLGVVGSVRGDVTAARGVVDAAVTLPGAAGAPACVADAATAPARGVPATSQRGDSESSDCVTRSAATRDDSTPYSTPLACERACAHSLTQRTAAYECGRQQQRVRVRAHCARVVEVLTQPTRVRHRDNVLHHSV